MSTLQSDRTNAEKGSVLYKSIINDDSEINVDDGVNGQLWDSFFSRRKPHTKQKKKSGSLHV